MFTNAKIALSAAIVLSTALSASAAKHRVSQVDRSAIYDVIPGYEKDGSLVEIPNPDRFGVQSQR